ncbi:Glutathione peroxidase [Saliniradius amylolyticus]|uniref:Glutathione peroxidase n=1 Tax=Saliniradius amylolyticus TaxID=2183582 RepID=A0A2S2E2H0_9ALTE|nr:glutathione peroxidase [Saliniradius amylolyticus]AWL11841.1 Glutathione peroxidase [Saliniradius amylolyticus]
MTSIYDFTIELANGEPKPLADYRGQVMLIVNTASYCGFTPQYQGLENLYQKFKDNGFVVLGFPCNQFGNQEPDSEETIQSFCQRNYGVTFPLFKKVDVNGKQAEPLFDYLKQHAPGILGSRRIKWNFTKFLVGSNGKVLKRFGSVTKPKELSRHVHQALQKGL